MRIRGVDIPPGHLRWAAAGTAVTVLGILIAMLVSASGVFGSAPEDQGTTVRATVVTGVPCDRADATETVKFTMNGTTHQARFDGCGHTKNERVEVTVPTTLPPNPTVHAAEAAVGDSNPGENVGLLLIVVAGVAGAGYTYLACPTLKTRVSNTRVR